METKSIGFKNRRRIWSLIFGFWAFIALLYTSQNLLSRIVDGGPVDWARLFSWSLTRWLLWAALTPLVFGLARRFYIERSHLVKSILTHLGLGALISFLHLTLELIFLYLIWKLFGETIETGERFIGLLTYTFHVNMLIYWAIVGTYKALDYYHKFRERELKASQLEAQLSQAQLQALKTQIQPHFLFNTHHAILGLMLKKQNDAAMQMLTRLSDILRLTLENTEAQETSLKKELEFLDLYLEIQQTRFKDRLKIQRNIEPETLNARIPNFIMQPLVENAIQHGIAPHSKAGLLEIKTKRENGILKLQVRDDGPGFSKEQEQNLEEGVGLANTRSRLEQLYGEVGNFEFSNVPEGGFQVTIEIPFQEFRDE